MYAYFIDAALAQKYHRDFNRIEARLTDLGIKGTLIKLTALHDLTTVVSDSLKAGAHTLAVIGSDGLFSRVVSALRPFPATKVGLVPFGKGPFALAKTLGIPGGLVGCDILAARRLLSLDAGLLNQRELFLSAVEVKGGACALTCERKFSLTDPAFIYAGVQNLLTFLCPSACDCPYDGTFKVWMKSKPLRRPLFPRLRPRISICPAATVEIRPTAETATAVVDGERTIPLPVTVELLPHHLSCIVGKMRTFD